MICETLTNRDIFAITEFNNCFIIRLPVLFLYLNRSLTAHRTDLPFFTQEPVAITHEQNIICSKTHIDSTAHEQTIICRQLFAGHVVGSRPMKKEGNNASNDNRAYLLRTEITKSHQNNHICQHRGMKTSTVTPSFYYVFNISLYGNDTIPSFIGNLWRVLLPGNHLKEGDNYQ